MYVPRNSPKLTLFLRQFFFSYSLDDLFGGGIPTGSIIELCGLTATGKTQICNTIAQNIVYKYDVECFWIDSKFEFSSKRLISNLKAKQLTTLQIGVVLKKIKFERILTAEKLIQALEELLEYHPNLQILIIDSIPAMMLQLQNEKSQSKNQQFQVN